MADTLKNEITGVELTPYIDKVVRTPSLTQVINIALNGLPHIQNIGNVSYQLTVDFIIHVDMDSLLMNAWRDGDLIKIIDGDVVRYGYIINVTLGEDYAEGYHTGRIILQEEIAI